MALSIYEKEFLAVLLAIEKWKHYLQGNHFIVRTYQESLKHLLEQKITTALQHKWIAKLMGLDYEIQYRKGSENQAVDALSRRRHVMVTASPQWIKDVQDSYKDDSQAQYIITSLLVNPNSVTNFSYINGVLRYKNRVYINDKSSIKD